MPAKLKPDAFQRLEQAKAANPLYWDFLEANGIPEETAQLAKADPFLVEKPDRMTFSPTFLHQLIIDREPGSARWNYSDPTLVLTPIGMHSRLNAIWRRRCDRISVHITHLVSQSLREAGELRRLCYNNELNAALADYLAGTRPNLKDLTSRIFTHLDPEQEAAGSRFAGANATAQLDQYCRRHYDRLDQLQAETGPVVLQFWLNEVAASGRERTPPAAAAIAGEAYRAFVIRQRRRLQPKPEHWEYFTQLGPEFLRVSPPADPATVAELCEMLDGQPPHADLYRAFAQERDHALRWAKLEPQLRPNAAAYIQWLNQQLQQSPDPSKPDSLLLAALYWSTSADPSATYTIRSIFASIPTQGPGHRPPNLVAWMLNQVSGGREAALAAEFQKCQPDLENRLPKVIIACCRITGGADGFLRYTAPDQILAYPWLAKANLDREEAQAELQACRNLFNLRETNRFIISHLLRELSSLWQLLPAATAEIYYRNIQAGNRRIRDWLDKIDRDSGSLTLQIVHHGAQQANPQLIRRISGLLAPEQPLTLAMYNAAKAGGASWYDVLDTNPGAAVWWLVSPKARPKVNHAGQIVERCKAEYAKAGGRRWNALTRAPADQVIALLRATEVLEQIHQSRQELVWLVDCLPENPSQRRLPPPAAARALIPERPPKARPNERQLAQLFLLEYARLEGDWPNAREAIIRINDWAKNQPANQPLPARTWRRASRHSERWHRDLAGQELQRKRAELLARHNGRIRAWPSAFEFWDDPESSGQFHALSNEYELLVESSEMRHCVGTGHYGAECFQGKSRIYRVTAPQVRFTLELSNSPGRTWEPRQLTGNRNNPAPGPVVQAAGRFAKAYADSHALLSPQEREGWWTQLQTDPETPTSAD